ncbi:MAG: hypothetical protein HY543_07020 [Deltaproteobacteria bacterium]|nr:hypothetical protein [Deltaproteobacteria bacterium]
MRFRLLGMLLLFACLWACAQQRRPETAPWVKTRAQPEQVAGEIGVGLGKIAGEAIAQGCSLLPR